MQFRNLECLQNQVRRQTLRVDDPRLARGLELNWLRVGGDDGQLVRVTGIVAQCADLPVFIPNPDLEPMQGIPVAEGTDLDEAAKRFILEAVMWERVGNAANNAMNRTHEQRFGIDNP